MPMSKASVYNCDWTGATINGNGNAIGERSDLLEAAELRTAVLLQGFINLFTVG